MGETRIMANRKQTDGQDYCICGHKEFHHRKIFSNNKDKYICCMTGCDCENFEKRIEIIHDDNWSGHYSCSPKGIFNKRKASIVQRDVTCLKCLEVIRLEWERQSKEFKGQPRLNAVSGLKRTIKQISELNSKEKKE